MKFSNLVVLALSASTTSAFNPSFFKKHSFGQDGAAFPMFGRQSKSLLKMAEGTHLSTKTTATIEEATRLDTIQGAVSTELREARPPSAARLSKGLSTAACVVAATVFALAGPNPATAEAGTELLTNTDSNLNEKIVPNNVPSDYAVNAPNLATAEAEKEILVNTDTGSKEKNELENVSSENIPSDSEKNVPSDSENVPSENVPPENEVSAPNVASAEAEKEILTNTESTSNDKISAENPPPDDVISAPNSPTVEAEKKILTDTDSKSNEKAVPKKVNQIPLTPPKYVVDAGKYDSGGDSAAVKKSTNNSIEKAVPTVDEKQTFPKFVVTAIPPKEPTTDVVPKVEKKRGLTLQEYLATPNSDGKSGQQEVVAKQTSPEAPKFIVNAGPTPAPPLKVEEKKPEPMSVIPMFDSNHDYQVKLAMSAGVALIGITAAFVRPNDEEARSSASGSYPDGIPASVIDERGYGTGITSYVDNVSVPDTMEPKQEPPASISTSTVDSTPSDAEQVPDLVTVLEEAAVATPSTPAPPDTVDSGEGLTSNLDALPSSPSGAVSTTSSAPTGAGMTSTNTVGGGFAEPPLAVPYSPVDTSTPVAAATATEPIAAATATAPIPDAVRSKSNLDSISGTEQVPDLITALEEAAVATPGTPASDYLSAEPSAGDYLSDLNTGTSTPTGAGITSYLDALPPSARAAGGAGMTSYLDTMGAVAPQAVPSPPFAPSVPAPAATAPLANSVPATSAGGYLSNLNTGAANISGAGITSYLDAFPPGTRANGAGMTSYLDTMVGGAQDTDSPPAELSPVFVPPVRTADDAPLGNIAPATFSGDYQSNLNTEAIATSGAGITSYLDDFPPSTRADGGAGMTSYLDTMGGDVPATDSPVKLSPVFIPPVSYLDGFPPSTRADGGAGMTSYLDTMGGDDLGTDSPPVNLPPVFIPPVSD